MSKFKVGDRVRIRKDSRDYTFNNPYNPIDTEGIVEHIVERIGNNSIYVAWVNNRRNFYREEDLEFNQPYLNEQKIKKLLGVR